MVARDLVIRQEDVCAAYIVAIEDFLKALEPRGYSRAAEELLSSLKPLKNHPKAMLKKIDLPLSRYFTQFVGEKTSIEARIEKVKLLETTFHRERGRGKGQELCELVFRDVLPKEVRTIWVPGCGDSYEIGWIARRYPSATINCMDIDDKAIAATNAAIKFHDVKAVVATLCDLTKPEDLPASSPDLILFFNPFVIEHKEYQEMMRVLHDVGLSDSEKGDYLNKMSISKVAASIFGNLVERATTARIIISTMDYAEALAVCGYFKSIGKVPSVHRNPFAIKNPSILLASKRIALIEPKIYHYVIVVDP
jgi:hypothetical protein